MMITLKHRDILKSGHKIHIARATLTPERPKSLHDHDFFELLWVQNGKVRHHQPNGIEALSEGSVVFIRPGQFHGLQGRGDQTLVVSICIDPQLVKALGRQHASLSGNLFWSNKPEPAQTRRDSRQLAALNHAALQLERSKRDALAAEAFLLPLCAELTADLGQFPPDAPDWLVSACIAAKSPDVFREGAAGLVAFTGLAHPHVSRTMRRFLGQTPSEFINTIRMEHAARALISDSETISEIAADCGIPNMSHFHKLFRDHHDLTPLQYRQAFQRNVVQPT